MSFNGYVRLPPDSTGKKVAHSILVELDYDTGTTTFEIGSVVTGASSGLTGVISRVNGNVSAGELYVHLDRESPVLAIVGENLQVNGVTFAKAASTGTTSTLYIPSVTVTDHKNPFNGQNVNARGAASVTFYEGEPTIDAFGNLRTSQARAVAVYEHTQRNYDDLFSTTELGGGTAVFISQSAYYNLAVDNISGSSVQRGTNRYHYYLPGTGMLNIITLAMGDTGRNGNIRRWGYFDADNGMYWELSGSTINTVVRRNGVDSRTEQSQWNNDKLDGTGISEIDLDVSKANFYWIDFAWLGVGEVRFGVLNGNGERIIAHIHETANIGNLTYTLTPHLPIGFENTNFAGTAGPSEIHLFCAAVYADSIAKEDYTFWRNSDVETTGSGKTVTNKTPLFSLRNQTQNLLGNGINRVSIYPETLAIYATAPIKLEIYNDVTLTGDVWITSSLSTVAYDNQSTSMTLNDGFKFITLYAASGTNNIDLRQYYELNDEALTLRNNGDFRTYTYVATPLSGSSAIVHATLNYRELS